MEPAGSNFDAPVPRGGDARASVIYKAASWFEPLDWRAVFERDQPIEIDLGCGKGSFLLWAARMNPMKTPARMAKHSATASRSSPTGSLRCSAC